MFLPFGAPDGPPRSALLQLPGTCGNGARMIARALQNTGWLMGARGVNAVLSLVYLALATRALGVGGFGQFILVVTFAQALVGLVNFQTWQTVVRWGQDEEMRADATGFALALDLVSIVAGIAIAALLLALAGDWLPVARDLRGQAFAFTLASLFAIRSTPTGILRLHDRFRRAASADAATSIIRVIGAAIVVFAAPSIPAFLLVWGLAELGTAAIYWWLAARTQPVLLSHASLSRLPSRESEAWRFAIGTSLSGTLAISSRQVLVLLVGALGGAALAGIYRVAAQLGEGLLKLGQALLRATYPELVRSRQAAGDIAKRIGRIAICTGLSALLLALVAGQWVITLIAGANFLPAYVPMLLLTAAAALELAGASLEALLLARGHAMRNFALRAVPTLLVFAALPWLIASLGATGAALAVLAASAVTLIGLFVANRKVRVLPDNTQL